MECYTSDSCDSDSREQKTINLSLKQMDTAAVCKELLSIIEANNNTDLYEILYAYNNRMDTLPDILSCFSNLRIIDISGNNLTTLPNVFEKCPLTNLIAKNNHLTNESLPKCLESLSETLRELNLSGNSLTHFPEQVLGLNSLRYLYLSANRINIIPKEIEQLQRLQILYLSSNDICEVPASVGNLKSLNMLALNDNLIEHLPASIANLKHLKSLKLHQNRLRTLPTQIVKLKNLAELSLRDNPLVVRFIRDMTLQPPSLLELAGRCIKLHGIPINKAEVPTTLINYLGCAHCCVNPKCKGVFFDNRVEHIKFVDFCGMYRIPLLQYLCSSKCIVGSWETRELEAPPQPHIMRKVLLG